MQEKLLKKMSDLPGRLNHLGPKTKKSTPAPWIHDHRPQTLNPAKGTQKEIEIDR